MVEETVINKVKRYLASLPALGIHAKRAVLFGSFAMGRADEYSDWETDGARPILEIARREGVIITV